MLVAPNGATEPITDAIRRISGGAVEAYAENVPQGSPEGAMEKLFSGKNPILRGHKRKDATTYAFGAQFVEVRVHRRTREIRVPRMLGAFAAGTIVNPLTAHSQYVGGMIWGLGAALLEATEIDPHAARYVNDNLSEYHIAVNADVGEGRSPAGSRAGRAGEPARHQGHRRDRDRRHERGDRQCRLPRHGQARPRTADPARGPAVNLQARLARGAA